METFTYHTNSEQESRELASEIARGIGPGDVVVFSGDLGAGKSFFCREIIKTLCGEHTKVISPTFNLLQTYEYESCQIYHFDLYRLKHQGELYELGIEDALSGNICLIEWPDIASFILPQDLMRVEIDVICDKKRRVRVKKILKT